MTTSPYEEPRGIPLWMPLVGIFTAAISFYWMRDDRVTSAVVAGVMIAGFSGYRMGTVKLAGFFGGAALAITYAPAWGKGCEPKIAEFFGTSGLMSRVLSVGAIGIGITVAAMIVMALLSHMLFSDRPRLEAVNRWTGFLFGGVQGIGIMLLLLGGIFVVEPMAKERVAARMPGGKFAHAVSERVVSVAEMTRNSQVGPFVIEYNPFQLVPQLDQMQDSIQLARDPEKLNQLMQSPKIEELKQQPAMRQALDSLAADAEIQEVLRSGKPMDSTTAMSLMNNPTIMKLLEEPGFIGEMSKVLSDFDLAQ